MGRGQARGVARALWAAAAVLVTAAVAAAVAREAGSARLVWPHPLEVVVFAGLLLAVESSAVSISSSTSVSPGIMIVIAGISAFSQSGASHGGVLLAAGCVGLAGGLAAEATRRRLVGALLYNCSQYGLTAVGAAYAFVHVPGSGNGHLLVAGAAAALTFTALNGTFVLAYVVARHGRRPSAMWTDMQGAIADFLAFGMLGMLVGQLYTSLGALAVGLLLVPAAIARSAFASYLRLREAYETALQVFVRAIEAKDPYTAGHCERVACYAAYVGEELGFTPAQLERLHFAALMHDIGKLAVPSRLLNKPGRLTAEEYEQVRRHNEACIEILGRVDFLKVTLPVATDRHAHYATDPHPGEPEAMAAYAVAVADAFDAMTSTRAYRQALSQDVAFAELRDKAGQQFHPGCVEALITAIDRRGETYGRGHERDIARFDVTPPVAGVGSAGLGHLVEAGEAAVS